MEFDTLLSARALMGLSLVFHTFFTPLGIGLPVLLFAAEGLALRTGDQRYRELARAWTPAVGLLFAVGAVSGTVLSFELGLLWPRFMEYAGGIIGMPFSLEGFAFFTEAIFLAIYIYGWNRMSAFAHWLVTIPIVVSSAISAVFVISANAWMNTPEGFRVVDGRVVDVDPWDAMFNAAWLHEAIHGTLASYVVTGFAVAAVYAWLIWRRVPAVHPRLGLQLAMVLAAVAIPLQIVAGDFAARRVAELQPVKFAAMEGQYETERGAPLRIGGIPMDGETRYAIEIPKLLSFLGYRDFDAEVMGLNAVPPEDRPNELLTHLSFQVMVGAGFALLFIAGWYWVAWWRRRKAGEWLPGRALRWALVAGGFLSFAALQAGWFVTEFGRQPWVVYGFLRTSEGVTERDGILVFFVLFTLLYVVISAGLVVALLRWPHGPRRAAGLPGGARREAEGVA
ncbi:cytochrome ubiquinol oxidase subunit I [Tepidiforma sp.]|uniref:cytochrome ubiquinol oxidase subunit I n=1 Tax=Tepidiforma sp. TaxID=2682230 RepID=UPI002ADDCCB6|nr:cytochrome ubiquinol oxidase subunit I [Tepidiforma sp.]